MHERAAVRHPQKGPASAWLQWNGTEAFENEISLRPTFKSTDRLESLGILLHLLPFHLDPAF